MTDSSYSRPDLWTDLQRTGFYPHLAAGILASNLEGREVRSHLIHVETHFNHEDLHRHVTVLALADDVIAAAHLSDLSFSSDVPDGAQAYVSSEVIPLSKIGTVVISTSHANAAHWGPNSPVAEVTLSITWVGGQRMELLPVECPDPECVADHGLTGNVTPEDLVMRVAAEAEGQQAVQDAIHFARAVRRAYLKVNAVS